MRSQPIPPYPELERRPPKSFGWLDAKLLHDEWLSKLGPDVIAVLTFLALAADRRGASFWRRESMALALGMQRVELDRCLDRLRELGLVAQRPWQEGHDDGVWQLLPLPRVSKTRR